MKRRRVAETRTDLMVFDGRPYVEQPKVWEEAYYEFLRRRRQWEAEHGELLPNHTITGRQPFDWSRFPGHGPTRGGAK